MAEDDMDETRVDDEIGNYYGGLHMKKVDGQYFWGIENYKGISWSPIPAYVGDSLRMYTQEHPADV